MIVFQETPESGLLNSLHLLIQSEVVFAIAQTDYNPFAWVLYDIYKSSINATYQITYFGNIERNAAPDRYRYQMKQRRKSLENTQLRCGHIVSIFDY